VGERPCGDEVADDGKLPLRLATTGVENAEVEAGG